MSAPPLCAHAACFTPATLCCAECARPFCSATCAAHDWADTSSDQAHQLACGRGPMDWLRGRVTKMPSRPTKPVMLMDTNKVNAWCLAQKNRMAEQTKPGEPDFVALIKYTTGTRLARKAEILFERGSVENVSLSFDSTIEDFCTSFEFTADFTKAVHTIMSAYRAMRSPASTTDVQQVRNVAKTALELPFPTAHVSKYDTAVQRALESTKHGEQWLDQLMRALADWIAKRPWV